MFKFEDGGEEPTPKDIQDFYKKMLGSNWYKKRLYNNGYVTQDKNKSIDVEGLNEASKIARTRLYGVNNTRFQAQSTDDNIIDGIKKLFTKDPVVQGGSQYNPINKTVYYVEDQTKDLERLGLINKNSVLAHEYGHSETDAFPLSKFEENVLTKKLRPWIKNTHDKSTLESKADINAVRFNLYKKGLFDPETGQYKTETGKATPELLEQFRGKDTLIDRLLRNFGEENASSILNIIAKNNPSEENLMYAENGGMMSPNFTIDDQYQTDDGKTYIVLNTGEIVSDDSPDFMNYLS